MAISRAWACLAVAVAAFAAPAAQAQRMIAYSSGTGFFVTHDGHVLTNNHVIQNCDQISIHGDAMSTGVTLVARDPEHDLALLKAAFTSADMAYFNSMRQPLRRHDPVVIVGFPGDSWRGHDPVVRSSSIIDMKGPSGREEWLQFNDSAQRGNSGGPLLDSAGNVVGVVVAKLDLDLISQKYPEVKDVKNWQNLKKVDLAISLSAVKPFLERNNVQYQTRDSGIYLSPDRVNDRSRAFIVNVHCRKMGQ